MVAQRRTLSRLELIGSLANGFRRGPASLVLGDIRSQLGREYVDLKRKWGLRLSTSDLARVLAALQGIDRSRRYVRGYEYVYRHLHAPLSPEVVERLGGNAIFPVSRELVAFSKTWSVAQLRHTTSFLEQATRPGAPAASAADLRAGWEQAMARDGADAHANYRKCSWRLISAVALKSSPKFVSRAMLGIPQVEPYIVASAQSGRGYFDVLADAPRWLRVMVYIADANRPGYSLNDVHIPFTLDESAEVARAVDRQLVRVLGDEGARQHPLHSEQRERVEREHPIDVRRDYAEESNAGPV